MKKRVKSIQSLLALSAAALVLTGCFSGEKKEEAGAQIPSVVVEQVKKRNITVESELPGRTIASVMAEVRPQVGGIILTQNFEEGSSVEEGQTLYQIDSAIYEANLRQAKAGLERAIAAQYAAKMRAERMNSLRSSGSKAVSAQDVDDANAALAQANAEVYGAEAQVKNAEINVNYSKMLAPISGKIGKSNFTQGALVSPGQQLEMAVIQQLNPMRVDIAYSAAEYSDLQRKIKSGVYKSQTRIDQHGKEVKYHPVRIFLEDGSLYPETGYIRFEDPTVDLTTGSILLQAEFNNDEGALLPGMFVKTVVEQGIELGAVTVPQRILTQDLSGKSKVIIARKAGAEERAMMKEQMGADVEWVAQERSVVISRSHSTDWVLASGLEEGEFVVTRGFQLIQMALQRSPSPIIPVEILTEDIYTKAILEGAGK